MSGVVTLGTVRYTLVKNGGKVRVLTGGAKGDTGATGATGATGPTGPQADIAAQIVAATSKATPVDADQLALVDSAASNALKKLTWANVKATLWGGRIALGAGGYITGSTTLGGTIINNNTDTLNVAKFNNDQTSEFWGAVSPTASASNAIDLGKTAAKWRTGYFGTSIEAPQHKFPATQVPSSDPNTLDDYEEGTFTPAVTFGGAAVGVTYAVQEGQYTKVGNRVDFRLRVTLSNKGSSVGTLSINGLPFTVNGSVAASIYANQLTGISGGLAVFVATSGTTVSLRYLGTGLATVLTDANCNNAADIYVTGTYFV